MPETQSKTDEAGPRLSRWRISVLSSKTSIKHSNNGLKSGATPFIVPELDPGSKGLVRACWLSRYRLRLSWSRRQI